MGLLSTLGQGQGYLKAGFLGFPASGKTYTATLLAVGARAYFKLDGPLAMFDTEGGSEYAAARVKALTGRDLVGMRGRSFDDLLKVADECVAGGVSVLIVDSITHIWRELCDAYMQQLNERLAARRIPKRQRLEFQDWAAVKGLWNRWTDFYLNAPLHIIICGRAGFEYDMITNEETQRKELIKTGIKMKVEGEFGFEPSLLVEMEREQEPDGGGGFRLKHRATVLKDRFGVIDGASTVFDQSDPPKALEQTFEFFRPHVALLIPGAHAPIDTAVKTETGVDEGGDDAWTRERRTRTILCEEIQGDLVAAYPGQTAEEKKAKTELVFRAFRTRSWTAVEQLPSAKLRDGLAAIRAELVKRGKLAPAEPPAEPADSVTMPVTVPDGDLTAELLDTWEQVLVGAPTKADLEARWAALQTCMAYQTSQPEVRTDMQAVHDRRLAEITEGAVA